MCQFVSLIAPYHAEMDLSDSIHGLPHVTPSGRTKYYLFSVLFEYGSGQFRPPVLDTVNTVPGFEVRNAIPSRFSLS